MTEIVIAVLIVWALIRLLIWLTNSVDWNW